MCFFFHKKCSFFFEKVFFFPHKKCSFFFEKLCFFLFFIFGKLGWEHCDAYQWIKLYPSGFS